MTDATCQVCHKPFTYERKFRPRIYCDACRGPAYKAHTVGSYNPEYERWYRENVRKPKLAARAVTAMHIDVGTGSKT